MDAELPRKSKPSSSQGKQHSDISIRMIRLPTVSTGNRKIDAEIAKQFSQIGGVVNSFQTEVRNAFKSVEKRTSSLEGSVQSIYGYVDQLRAGNKVLADQLGEIIKEIEDGERRGKQTTSPSDLAKVLSDRRERARTQQRGGNGRFISGNGPGDTDDQNNPNGPNGKDDSGTNPALAALGLLSKRVRGAAGSLVRGAGQVAAQGARAVGQGVASAGRGVASAAPYLAQGARVAAPYVLNPVTGAAAAAVGAGALLHHASKDEHGLTLAERGIKHRGGTVAEARRRAYMEERKRLGIDVSDQEEKKPEDVLAKGSEKQTGLPKEADDDVNVLTKGNITLAAVKDITIQARGTLTLKGTKIVLDAEDVEFKGALQRSGGGSGSSGGRTPDGTPVTRSSLTQGPSDPRNPLDPDSVPLSKGALGVGKSGSSSSRGGEGGANSDAPMGPVPSNEQMDQKDRDWFKGSAAPPNSRVASTGGSTGAEPRSSRPSTLPNSPAETSGDILPLPKTSSDPNAQIFQGRMGRGGPNAQVANAMERAAKDLGVDPRVVWGKASVESGYQAHAKSPMSSASGLGQILKGTWKEIAGYPEAKKFGIEANDLSGRFDPYKSAAASMLYSQKNLSGLKKSGLIDDETLQKNPGLYYVPHNLGPDGAKRFLRALKNDPNAPVSRYLKPIEIKNNPSIYMKGGRMLSAKEALANIEAGKFGEGFRKRNAIAEEEQKRNATKEQTAEAAPSKEEDHKVDPNGAVHFAKTPPVQGNDLPEETPGQFKASPDLRRSDNIEDRRENDQSFRRITQDFKDEENESPTSSPRSQRRTARSLGFDLNDINKAAERMKEEGVSHDGYDKETENVSVYRRMQMAKVNARVPMPDTSLADRSGEEVTASVAQNPEQIRPERVAEARSATQQQSDPDQAIRMPTHNPESAEPTPGSDGYGTGRRDPDGNSFLAM